MTHLPSGTVTFLFTDVQGSTELAREYPNAWDVAQQRHHAILREACESHGGYVFKIIGDAFQVAFSNAEAGLQAAIVAQRALQAEAWVKTPIRVRMGLHTGAAEIIGSEYHGYMTLAQAARVMSTAFGDQMLLSNASYVLLASHLPSGIGLRDMGEHRLKGLLNPERLWQVDVPGLPQQFPSLQSLNAIPSNLPIQLTSFVGREHELSELQQRMLATHLLTLIGSGGVGKTRLALELAAHVLDQFTDGVWLFELATFSQPERVSQSMAATLGLRDYAGRTIQEILLDFLSGKKCLLILDNCEHLIGACAQLADTILHHAPGVRVIATSREALGISGELAWPVPSLAVPEPKVVVDMAQLKSYPGLRLFVDRAAFAAPGFKLDTKNADAVRQICYRLDGIPLAIELAAARVKALSPENIAKRLDDRFRLLTGGSRTALPRQQTLQATIEWSYLLLSETERILLNRLSVFTGGWTLDAAEQVCARELNECADVILLLTRLVDKSLVAMDDTGIETRYHLLETIRQYAIEKLNCSQEAMVMRDRHLEYFLLLRDQIFNELNGLNAKDQIGTVKQLGPDLDNIRQAIRWALETERAEGAYKLVDGFLHLFIAHAGENEILAWSLAICASQSLDARLRTEVLLRAADMYIRTGQFDKQYETLQRVKVMAESLNDPHLLVKVLIPLSLVAAANYKQWDKVREYYDQHIDLVTRHKLVLDEELVFFKSVMNSLLAMAVGDYSRAVEEFRFYYDYAHKVGNKMASSAAARQLGYTYLLAGDTASARTLFHESMVDNHAFGDRLAVSACLYGYGTLAEKTGDLPRSTCLFGAAVKLMKSTGLPTLPWDTNFYQPSLTVVKAQLDQPALAAMWAKGEAMSLEQAIAYALETAFVV